LKRNIKKNDEDAKETENITVFSFRKRKNEEKSERRKCKKKVGSLRFLIF
jgi:hypothetical protein